MSEELNPNTQDDSIEAIAEYARSLPGFPNKELVLQRLETGNLNRYQEAILTLNENIAALETTPAGESSASREQLQSLLDRIARLESKDPIAE